MGSYKARETKSSLTMFANVRVLQRERTHWGRNVLLRGAVLKGGEACKGTPLVLLSNPTG